MPKKTVNQSAIPAEELALKGVTFVQNKDRIKALEDENKKLRKPLEDYLSKNGATSDKGSKFAILRAADMDVVLTHTLRTRATLVPDAEEILRKNAITEPIETVTIVREDVLAQLHEDGTISDELYKSLYEVSDSFAFSASMKKHYEEE